ncbi:hypothetical protein [Streptomyces cucumeris]|uniref:hypothetical protein n=1 Tax=Streptomyces cucumeris TaxID=2962890 RepID=UPI0020C90698|nr:hypothetical protein [Streptomyces sp. NEAU-Y11]MCP9205499.1 hypothetical protein [Streptomyces sp. NEAU-Y11]
MRLSITEQDIQRKAAELGLVQEGEPVPARIRSKVAAALLQEQAPAPTEAPPVAESIVIQPGGAIEIDGRPFPWTVQAEQMSVTLGPDGSGMVRLTIPARNVQITKPADESE